MIDDFGISYEIVLRWTSLDLTDDKSTLIQVMTSGKELQELPEPILSKFYDAIWCH